ncbi:hypothetical protein GCM10027416_09290 [Okibacterium endophyticum]
MTETRTRRTGLNTRDLLTCAAFGVATALLLIALSTITATIAALSPPAYAFIGAYTAIAPMLSLRLIGTPGSATITALCCAIIAWPFSALGLLIFIALVCPAVAMDLAFLLRSRIGAEGALWLGAVAGGITIFALSLPVISPDHFTTATIVLTLVGRVVSYAAACWISLVLARALRAAGIRRRSPSSRAPRS